MMDREAIIKNLKARKQEMITYESWCDGDYADGQESKAREEVDFLEDFLFDITKDDY